MPKSSLFLGSSTVSAIAAVGCVFELLYGQPRFGVVATSIILLVSVPLTAALFYWAVQSGRKEQES
ncbi:hypothetical protein [Leptolyngbya sp. FACHB-261]|uniref:hypothetical protein n=1 Tax=Leptolyngbya sp. FACHB-261 TaxID=2692806 RepID=UPI001681F6BA|nr:hypothetical protein [Leptolyngbya sp. FACHB-261]MBD2103727.1 hypothetical protein [Leptolyngbya sp. FACHB-261]